MATLSPCSTGLSPLDGCPLLVKLATDTLPVSTSTTNTSWKLLLSFGTMLLAVVANATYLPLPDKADATCRDADSLPAFLSLPSCVMLMRLSEDWPRCQRKMSHKPFLSSATRVGAEEQKLIRAPSKDMLAL